MCLMCNQGIFQSQANLSSIWESLQNVIENLIMNVVSVAVSSDLTVFDAVSCFSDSLVHYNMN